MEWYFLIAAAALGAVAGSFLNAFSYRFNTGRGMGGRSYCDTCGHTLGALDLVPIFSYLFLAGRCRWCRSKISIQNLLLEVAAACLGALIWQVHPAFGGVAPAPLSFAFWFVVWMTLLFTVVYDLRHSIIPWRCSILLGVLALASLFVNLDTLAVLIPPQSVLLAGPVLAAPLFLLSFVSRGRWMGWGDGALELSLGWFLGLSAGLSALMLAFWAGAAVGIALILLKKGLTMKTELPFAPFLVFGMFLAFFFHVDFFPALFLW